MSKGAKKQIGVTTIVAYVSSVLLTVIIVGMWFFPLLRALVQPLTPWGIIIYFGIQMVEIAARDSVEKLRTNLDHAFSFVPFFAGSLILGIDFVLYFRLSDYGWGVLGFNDPIILLTATSFTDFAIGFGLVMAQFTAPRQRDEDH